MNIINPFRYNNNIYPIDITLNNEIVNTSLIQNSKTFYSITDNDWDNFGNANELFVGNNRIVLTITSIRTQNCVIGLRKVNEISNYGGHNFGIFIDSDGLFVTIYNGVPTISETYFKIGDLIQIKRVEGNITAEYYRNNEWIIISTFSENYTNNLYISLNIKNKSYKLNYPQLINPLVNIKTYNGSTPKLNESSINYSHEYRIKRIISEYPNAYYCIIVPENYTSLTQLPVIFETPGNMTTEHNGKPDDIEMGYGFSKGRDYIIICAPFLNNSYEISNSWWGYGNSTDSPEITVEYWKAILVDIQSILNVDMSYIVYIGFSRGAIGASYVGLYDVTIANYWKSFIASSHYDGGSFTPDGADIRIARLNGKRTALVAGSNDSGKPNTLIGKELIDTSGNPEIYVEIPAMEHEPYYALEESEYCDSIILYALKNLPHLITPINETPSTEGNIFTINISNIDVNSTYLQLEYKFSSGSTWYIYSSTIDKGIESIQLEGLQVNTSYDFRWKALANNINYIDSEYSNIVTDQINYVGAIGKYLFNGTTQDTSGFGFDGTINGSVIYEQDRNLLPNNSIILTGNTYINFGNNFNYSNISILFWIKISSKSTLRCPIIFDVNGGLFISVTNGNNITIGRNGVAHDITSNILIDVDTYYCICVTIDDSNNTFLYIDDMVNVDETGIISFNNNGNLCINKDFPGSGDTIIDALYIFNKVLTEVERLSWKTYN